ncbi:hypothetical protein ACEUAO_21110, partial [Aeromonas caviae]|uniref:hypothetical protein n=1 Tax=Aeromonas caviae TaxID=648 RepID=UPI0038CFF88D
SHAFPGVGFCLGEGQEIDWIGHTEYSETRIEQLDHIFNLIGIMQPYQNGRIALNAILELCLLVGEFTFFNLLDQGQFKPQ